MKSHSQVLSLSSMGLPFRAPFCCLRFIGLYNNYFKENETIPLLPSFQPLILLFSTA